MCCGAGVEPTRRLLAIRTDRSNEPFRATKRIACARAFVRHIILLYYHKNNSQSAQISTLGLSYFFVIYNIEYSSISLMHCSARRAAYIILYDVIIYKRNWLTLCIMAVDFFFKHTTRIIIILWRVPRTNIKYNMHHVHFYLYFFHFVATSIHHCLPELYSKTTAHSNNARYYKLQW